VTGLATNSNVSFHEFFLVWYLGYAGFLWLYLLYVRCQWTIFNFVFLKYLTYIVQKNDSKNNYLKLGDQSQPNSNVLLY